MDPFILGMMIFTLIALVLIIGGIVTFPIFRRLGKALDRYLEAKQAGSGPGAGEADALRKALATMDARLQALEDRQGFVEKLLEDRPRDRLPDAERAEDA